VPSHDSSPPELELPSFRIDDSPPPADLAVRRSRRPPAPERSGDPGVRRVAGVIDESLIDDDAARVVRKLTRAGYEAYVVGGCMRDILLGGRPKDFDVATSARPEEVRALFRNSRIIGRRFRLAHVLFGPEKIIEVATFRRNPQTESPEDAEDPDDLLIRNDNVFGDAHEDAIRRDFTINALFYDLERHEILDWASGFDDVRARTIRTIGDPFVRFREDPVRMLRAVRFAAKLDLGIAPEVWDALVATREDLLKAARPRLFEDTMRLLRGGHAQRAMWLAWDAGLLAVILPDLAALLDDGQENARSRATLVWRKLAALDAMTKARGVHYADEMLCAVLLEDAIWEASGHDRDRVRAVSEFASSVVDRVAIPRRVTESIGRLLHVKAKLGSGRIPARLVRSDVTEGAVELLTLEAHARGESPAKYDALRRAVLEAPRATPVPRERRSEFPRGR
jgi:poly(A) polymerase